MIVHGGNLQNGTQLQATGGRYEPLADTWQPTSTVNAALISSSAGGWQWTGTELVVVSSFGRGRYSPETNSWGSISNQGMPSFYRNVPAVWDGESIVASYGYYYPRTDRWRSIFTSAIGVSGTEVWTGSELIAWDRGAGGRYTPGQLLDLDGDGRLDCSADCDDGNAALWSPPSEVTSLGFDADRMTLRWNPPADQGGTDAPLYDVLRSSSPSDFFTGTTCIAPDGLDTMAIDAGVPPQDAAFFYLVRAQSACSSGNGPLAVGPNNGIRYGRQCP